jgi:diguanylate cyclase (GGDEF)-like protein
MVPAMARTGLRTKSRAVPSGAEKEAVAGESARAQFTSHAGRAAVRLDAGGGGGGYLIPRRWAWMAPLLLAGAVLTALLTGTVPDVSSAICIAAGAFLCLPATFLATREGGRLGGWQRHAAVAAGVLPPMALFGFGIARWAHFHPGFGWDASVNLFVMIALAAAVLLHNRLAAIVAAAFGLLGGGALGSGSPSGLGVLAAGGTLGLAIAALRARRRGPGRAAATAHERARGQRRAEELLEEYEQTGQGWFWEIDRQGRITYVTPGIATLLGKSAAELEGRPFASLFRLDGDGQQAERTLAFHLETRSSFKDLEMQAAEAPPASEVLSVGGASAGDDDEARWWSVSGRPVFDRFNNFMGFRGSGTDLTERRRSERQVTQLARFDSLTKLANRFQMAEWLEKILTSPRVETRAGAVFLLDLDRFKQVNDTMGHPAGDALLKQVAERLGGTIGDRGRVGRLGGDEFQVILHGAQQREGLAHLARRIIENISQPYSIEGGRVTIGVSVGIALCPDDGTTSEALIRNADLALYAAKGNGRGRHYFYSEDLHADARERQQLEEDLREAIASGALELHYQPQVRTTSERITSLEALLRWKHPVHGYMSPARFVPVAEETGLVAQIGEWALRTACRDLAGWPEEVRVAVNVSPLQFANPALPAIVARAVGGAGINPGRLELEITESVFLGEDKSTESMFAALKGIGVRLALDDFGTGYSSLGYLKKAPFDKIKIDQSFVRGATVPGSRNGAIISSIVSLAEALGMETTAEGVETLDELDLVRVLGCSHVQGYVYERPMTSRTAAAKLSESLVAVAKGPRSARAPRQTMLRKVVLDHGSHVYHGTIRNVSRSGAMIEGLWNVPPGTVFGVHLSEDYLMMATARWSKEDRMGVEFAQPLEVDDTGAMLFRAARQRRERQEQEHLRRAG